MMLKVTLALVLSQYVRSKVDDADPASQCLWWMQDKQIVLRQHVDGDPELTGDAEFTAISKSIATWQTQLTSCASLRLLEGERTRTRDIGFFEKLKTETSDSNENVILFRLRKCADVVPASDGCFTDSNCGNKYDCWEHQSAAIAITTTSYNPETGLILDSDIEYNVPSFLFTTVDSPACVAPNYNLNCVATDVQNTTTHELGHLLGLAHFSGTNSTMNPRANPGETSKRSLDQGTAQFVCDAYPAGKPTKTCKIVPVSSTLGTAAKGCSSAPGLLPLLAGLAFVRRRRAR
ncbi:MAG: myxosortase-dependent metalloprotease, MXAN_2677/MXAN_2678 family [Myxococcota bacterium]